MRTAHLVRGIIALWLVGCGGRENSTSSPEDPSVSAVDADGGGSPPSSAPDGSTEGGPIACNAVTNVGPVIDQLYAATEPVTGTGGPTTSGTYVLTAASVYTGTGGASGRTGMTFQETVVVDFVAKTFERVQIATNDAGGGESSYRANGTFAFATSGPLYASQSCPAGPLPFDSYDSDGTTVRLYASGVGAGPHSPALMLEYTKR